MTNIYLRLFLQIAIFALFARKNELVKMMVIQLNDG